MFHFKSIAFAACLVMAASGQSAASSYDDCRNGNGFLDPEKQFAHCDEALKAALDTKPRAFLQFKRASHRCEQPAIGNKSQEPVPMDFWKASVRDSWHR